MGIDKSASAERRALVLSLIAERERTGQTWRELAARSGMAYPTLTGWVWRLRRETSGGNATPSKPGFVELIAKDRRAREHRTGFDLVLRGRRRVRVGIDFDEQALARLVRVLEAC